MNTSCDSDDDLPRYVSIQTNSFCYGDQTTNFKTVGAFRAVTTQVINSGIVTPVTMLGDGISIDNMNVLQGTGPLIELRFFGNSLAGLQTGLYQIVPSNESATVEIRYALDFDAASTVPMPMINIDSGRVKVEAYSTGYAINISGIDENGDDFHGIYLGNVNLLP